MPHVRRPRRAGLLAAAALGLAALTVPNAASATPPPVDYVNLGDSFSAGSGILPLAEGSNPLCTQAAANYAHTLAEEHGYALTDVSCGGAQTSHFTSSQFPGVAPQADALSEETDLVTMTIGGNDNNTFISAVLACGSAGLLTFGHGSPCQNIYGDSFEEAVRTSTYANVVGALKTVKEKAPNARVAISGYPWLLPPTGGCFPFMPIARGDVPYLRDLQTTLNDAVERAAEATGAVYVDQSAASEGHDACQPLGTRWIEPAFGSLNYVPVHPNALGERGMAEQFAATLNLR
ncbi:SGNH/GDSL hydrolase family protein [Streptomyces sp. JJ38]|uniref:SGNH/GDSL hydrolase family protein n=1 Tax=Streptomyces sp. JJ38 TaxID=2738128 RepID=UPI001C576946|nr:SGNH/GDSL hydrolase family protein [Streptomyces sp. JJ38]MBW1596691.1 SGNH/GDSL hydrolase family protein [Streptomyces sp. JJ38]